MAKKEYYMIHGNLGAVKYLTEAGYRLQTARELQDDHCKDCLEKSLKNDYFYVADGSVFYQDPKKGTLSWAHTDGEHNLVIQPQYLERALIDLRQKTHIFRPDSAQESWDAIKCRSTKRFALSDLKLVRESDESSFMPIKTGNYGALSPVQQEAAKLVGFTPRNATYLDKKGIINTRLWFPSPEYVIQVLAEGKDPFWRTSWLSVFDTVFPFDRESIFDADSCRVGNLNRLRGVRSCKN